MQTIIAIIHFLFPKFLSIPYRLIKLLYTAPLFSFKRIAFYPMNQEKPFSIQIPGVTPNGMSKLQGPAGTFFVKDEGGMPDMKNCFFYGDDSCQFFFYADIVDIKSSPDSYNIEVHAATSKRFSGLFSLPSVEVSKIEGNIRQLFEQRRFYKLDAPLPSGEFPREIRFTWRVAK